MILRPLEPQPATHGQYADAWSVVERLQRQSYGACWMITQPTHSALSGEIAAKLSSAQIPSLEAPLIMAVALHDGGWGGPDAQAIVRSRTHPSETPRSFLQMELAVLLEAWSHSITMAGRPDPAGGYAVSRHFCRIAEQRLARSEDPEASRQKLKAFVKSETARQKRFAAKQSRTAEELERLTDILQLCDLISLYICCGTEQSVEFPECCGLRMKLRVEGGRYYAEPKVLSGVEFLIGALPFPHHERKSPGKFDVKVS